MSDRQRFWPSATSRLLRVCPNQEEKVADQPLRWSSAWWSPPPESNRRPHPYHEPCTHRCAAQRLPRSLATVEAKLCAQSQTPSGAGGVALDLDDDVHQGQPRRATCPVISQHPPVEKLTPLAWKPPSPKPSKTSAPSSGADASSRRPWIDNRPLIPRHHPIFIWIEPPCPRSRDRP
jgi:hypothetical protein